MIARRCPISAQGRSLDLQPRVLLRESSNWFYSESELLIMPLSRFQFSENAFTCARGNLIRRLWEYHASTQVSMQTLIDVIFLQTTFYPTPTTLPCHTCRIDDPDDLSSYRMRTMNMLMPPKPDDNNRGRTGAQGFK